MDEHCELSHTGLCCTRRSTAFLGLRRPMPLFRSGDTWTLTPQQASAWSIPCNWRQNSPGHQVVIGSSLLDASRPCLLSASHLALKV